MSDFVNEPIEVATSLPQLDDQAFTPVDPNWLRASLVSMAAVAGAVLLIGGVSAVWLASIGARRPLGVLIIAAVLAALIAVAAVARLVEVRHISYQVRTQDISYRSGVLVQRVSTVPFVRVQHARIRQGPIQRRYGIATLEVNSAGPDLKIHGLPAALAERLKTLVVERAGDLVEDP